MTLPNVFTLLRIALLPAFGACWLSGRPLAALALFALAGLTDLLDGFFARALNQRTQLGLMLDPIADKLTLLIAYLVGSSVGAVPRWLAALVIGRDIVLSLGAGLFAFVVHGRYAPATWHPTRLGKYSTFFQVGTIGLALLGRVLEAEPIRPWVAALILVTALMTIVSGAQYVASGARALGRPPRPRMV